MNNTSPDVFYQDVLINNIASSTPTPVLASMNESRTIPYLYNPYEYYGAVTQFTIDAGAIGIMNFEIQPSPIPPPENPDERQNDRNLGIYQIVMSYNGTDVSGNVIWEPQNLAVSASQLPPPPSAFSDGLQDLTTSYYTVYAYSWFNDLLYKTFVSVYDQLQVLQPTLPVGLYPNMDYISSTQLFSLYANAQYYNQSINPNAITINFNGPLNALFSYMPASRILIGGNTYYKLIMNNSTTFTDNTIAPPEIYMTQERTSIRNWSQIASIVITTQSLPIYKTNIFEPLVYYNNSLITGQLNNALQESIILEYIDPNGLYNDRIAFNPTAQYPIFEMNSTSPLYNFDLKYYVRTTNGLLRPIYLGSGSACFTRMGYFKKSAFRNLKW
jgi:hypothetical protein